MPKRDEDIRHQKTTSSRRRNDRGARRSNQQSASRGQSGQRSRGQNSKPRERDAEPALPRPSEPLPSVETFAEFGLSADVQRGVDSAGFTTPRPIQAATITAAMGGSDVLGLAQTGTGKTAAFVLPILERLLRGGRSNRSAPKALIVAPTRELAAQIHAEIGVLAEFTSISSTTVFGGVNQNPQVRALRTGVDIIVACPGRLLDLYGQGLVNLREIEVLVLDEADHMFDLGFLPAIKKIVAALPAERQNLLFSATMPREIRHLADNLLDRPYVVELNHSSPAETIEHALYPCAETRKIDLLQHLFDDDDFTSGIVFLRTKHRAKRLAQKLDRAGHAAVALQGNMSQSQREKAMKGFRDGTFDILVATDIAARGIDVAGVSHVVNFDVPVTPDAYTHRIGRTGRSEQAGRAMTLVTNNDYDLVKAIEKRLGGEPIQRVRLEGFGGERRAGERGGARQTDPRNEESLDRAKRGRGGSGRGPKRRVGSGAVSKQGGGKGGPKRGGKNGGSSFGKGLDRDDRTGGRPTRRTGGKAKGRPVGAGTGGSRSSSTKSSGPSFGAGLR